MCRRPFDPCGDLRDTAPLTGRQTLAGLVAVAAGFAGALALGNSQPEENDMRATPLIAAAALLVGSTCEPATQEQADLEVILACQMAASSAFQQWQEPDPPFEWHYSVITNLCDVAGSCDQEWIQQVTVTPQDPTWTDFADPPGTYPVWENLCTIICEDSDVAQTNGGFAGVQGPVPWVCIDAAVPDNDHYCHCQKRRYRWRDTNCD